MIESTQLIIGLPESGKSTFIGALSFVAERAEVPSAMRLVKLGTEDDRINGLIECWLKCERPGRTLQAGEQMVTLLLEDSATSGDDSSRCMLVLPDLAGETFEHQWTDRQCTRSYFELAATVNQVVLFVHAEKVEEPLRIEELLDMAGAVPESEPKPSLPTQVVLVDLLQALVHPPFLPRAMRVAVVISAWDLVEAVQAKAGEVSQTPSEWMKSRLPLLQQYLATHNDTLTWRVWGASAQGGSYDDQETIEQLRAEPHQERRIRLVSDTTTTYDLTEIVHWLLRGGTHDEAGP